MSQSTIQKNRMDVLWHEYTDNNGENIPVTQASLTEKASIIGRVSVSCSYPVEPVHGVYEVL